jgi:hypothetical protein
MKVKTRTAKKHTAYEVPKWELGYLEAAEKDARGFLTDEQYAHVVQLFDDLAYESEPAKSQTQDVHRVHEFYELRDKGGVLGKINVRVYFAVIDERKLILALATYKKEDEGQMPQHIVIRVRNRLRIALGALSEETQKG